MEGGWFDDEAIQQERWDADLEQAQFEAEGNEFWRRIQRMKKLYEEGDLAAAAATCPHGGGYPLDSPAAGYADDPNEGEQGFRCCDCGSRFDKSPLGDGGRVTVPCEIAPGGLAA
jgi:Rieske Fe-S protein